MKSEPDVFGIDDVKRKKGIKSLKAMTILQKGNHLSAAKEGDTQTLNITQATRYNQASSAASLNPNPNSARGFQQQSNSILSSKPAIASGGAQMKAVSPKASDQHASMG